MMSRDKEGNFVFKKGTEYRPKEWFSPVWPKGQVSKCMDVKPRMIKGEVDREVKDGMGYFVNGDDSRWFAASAQFEESN